VAPRFSNILGMKVSWRKIQLKSIHSKQFSNSFNSKGTATGSQRVFVCVCILHMYNVDIFMAELVIWVLADR